MDREILIILGPIIGVLVGSLGTIAVTWITKHYEEEAEYKRLIISTSMEYFKEALIAARNSKRISYVWPYESYVISIAHLVNKVVNKRFKIDQIDEIMAENRRLIQTMEKSYSEINKKKEKDL